MDDITLSVGLEAGQITDAASELSDKVKQLFESTAGTQTSAKLDELLLKVKNLYKPFEDAKAKAEALRGTTFVPEGLVEISNEIVDINNSFQDLKQSAFSMLQVMKEFKQTHGIPVEATTAYRNMRETMESLSNQYIEASKSIDYYNSKLQYLQQLEESLRNKAEKSGAEQDVLRWDKIATEIKVVEHSAEQYESQLVALNTQAEKLALKMQKLKASKPGKFLLPQDQAQLDSYEQTYERVKQAMFSNRNAMKEARAEAVRLRQEIKKAEDTDEYKQTIEELDEYSNKLSIATKKVEELKAAENSQSKTPNTGYDYNSTNIINMFNNIQSLQREIENFFDGFASQLPIQGQIIYSIIKGIIKHIIDEFINTAKQLASITMSVAKQVASILRTVVIKAVNATITALRNLLKVLTSIASTVILSPFKKIADAIGNIGKKAQESTPSLKQIGRAFLQYGIGARSLYRLINKLRTALFEGFADLALAYEPFNEAMSMIVTALDYLKNSFAAAFAPVIEYVAPVLSIFITKVAEAVQWIGQLIAALTGKEFVMAVPVFKNYAESTSAGASAAKEQEKADKNAAKAANDAAKAEKKRTKELEKYKKTIAGFDDVELLKVPDEKDTESDTSPKDYDLSTPTLDAALQKFKPGGSIQAGIQKFADLLKKAWVTADAYDLGQLVSRQLGNLLRAFNKNIPKIQEVTTKVAKIIASFLAGFLSINDTFKVLGVAIANVINTIFKTLQAFLKTFMDYDGFKNLGKDIYYTIVNALANIDWETIYDVFRMMGQGIAQTLNEVLTKPDFWKLIFTTLTNMLRAILIRIEAFSHELHWGEIGKALASGINAGIANFPRAEMIEAIVSFFGGLWELFINLVSETHWDELGALIGGIICNVLAEFDPVEFADGLLLFLDAILTTFIYLLDRIPWEDIGNDIALFIIEFFQNFPMDDAVTAVSMFLDGLWATFINFVDTMDGHWEEIGSTIATFIIRLFENFEPVEFARGVIKFLNGLWDAFMAFVNEPGWDEVVDKIATAIGTFLEEFPWREKADDLLTFLNNLISKLKEKIDDANIPELIDKVYNYLKNSKEFDELCDNVVSLIATIIEDKLRLKAAAFKLIGAKILTHILVGFRDFILSGGPISLAANLLVSAIEGAIEAQKSGTIDIGTGIGAAVDDGLSGEADIISNTARGISSDIQTELSSGDYALIMNGKGNEVVAGIDNFRPNTTGAISTVSAEMQSALASGDWDAVMRAYASDASSALSESSSNLVDQTNSIADDMHNSFTSQDWFSVGDNLITGIWNGLNNGWDWLSTSVWNLAVDLYNTACEALDIGSPSKLFADKVGEMIPAGIGVGIEANADSALDAVDDLSGGLVDTAKRIKLPPIAMGEVIPYSIANNSDNTQTTLTDLLDIIQMLQDNMITNDDLVNAINLIIRNMPDFYIGPEKLARIVKQGNIKLDRRYGY